MSCKFIYCRTKITKTIKVKKLVLQDNWSKDFVEGVSALRTKGIILENVSLELSNVQMWANKLFL
jgi:hypothetical protein